jgi:multidrug resistance protein
MIVQGIAPLFWGSLSDTVGRRSVYIATFIVYLSANIGCALAPNFVALMVFRGLQAAGSAATIAIGAGVIGDITESKERGGLIGIFGGLRMMGQSVGPVFGGILTEYLGYHSIFWFLTIFGGLVLLTILVFLPETLRTIAGSGTTRLHGVHKPWIQMIRGQPDVTEEAPPRDGARRVGKGTVLDPLRFLFEKDVFVTLFYGSIIYTIWSMVTSSTTSLFEEHFHLSNLHMGLAFLPNGTSSR